MLKKSLLVAVLSLLCAWPAAAKPRTVMGSEQHKTHEAYNVSAFDTLRVEGQIEVEFTQKPGDTHTVSYTGPYNLAEQVNITSEAGTLFIRYMRPISVLGDQHLRVFVTGADLKRIEAGSGAEVYVQEPLTTQQVELVAYGPSDIEVDDLQAQTVKADIKEEGEVKIGSLICQTLDVKAIGKSSFDVQQAECDTVSTHASNRAEISISGLNGQAITAENWHAAETELKGRVKTASLTARGHSEIDAAALQAENADVMAERSSHIGVRVSDTLNATTQGRSVVEYKGWPQQINRTGKGTVKQN